MTNMLIIFAENVSSFAFALQKLLTFLLQKNIKVRVFQNTLATTVNEFVINELVKLTML